MIIVKILGGLGNQMFQYAYALSLSVKGYNVKIDISGFQSYTLHTGFELDSYKVSLPKASQKELSKFGVNTFSGKLRRKVGLNKYTFIEKTLQFQEELSNPEDNKYIVGYFQNEEYFYSIREMLIKEFTVKQELSSFSESIKNEILATNNSISLHVRRGDYVNDKNTNQVHGTCSLEYYNDALMYMSKKYSDFQCFVFSDDIEWARKNIQGSNISYIDSEIKRPPHEDIYLMSLCQNNIIANSSFSWWGAWLNTNDGKVVISPKRWFVDKEQDKHAGNIAPQSWFRI